MRSDDPRAHNISHPNRPTNTSYHSSHRTGPKTEREAALDSLDHLVKIFHLQYFTSLGPLPVPPNYWTTFFLLSNPSLELSPRSRELIFLVLRVVVLLRTNCQIFTSNGA